MAQLWEWPGAPPLSRPSAADAVVLPGRPGRPVEPATGLDPEVCLGRRLWARESGRHGGPRGVHVPSGRPPARVGVAGVRSLAAPTRVHRGRGHGRAASRVPCSFVQ
eukprot:7604808-Pyramimonas_sp.AAC.1